MIIYERFILIMLRPNPEDFVYMNWKGREGGGMEGRIQKLSLAGIHTEARAASQSHFYGSGIWVNVPKRRCNACFREQCDRRS